MSRSTRKPTLLTPRKVSTRISLSMPRRLTRTDTFRLLWIFCFRNHYFTPLSTWDGMFRPGLACADCAGWSGSIHYADPIMLVFSWNGSDVFIYISNDFEKSRCMYAILTIGTNNAHAIWLGSEACSTNGRILLISTSLVRVCINHVMITYVQH